MATEEKFTDAEAYESSAFEALEKDFQEVLQELVGDKSLEHFRLEYEKLHRALKKSHESEKRLIKKCRELNAEIVSNAVKVQTALKLSQEDQSTIASLKKEIERAWKMVEASHEKEQRAKETIHNLKVEIANLSRLVEAGAGLSINQENTVNNLVQQKNDLIKQRDGLQNQVAQLTEQNTELNERVQRLETEKSQGEVEVQNLKDMLSIKKTEAEREQRRKERLDKELAELRVTLEERHKELKGFQQQILGQTDQVGAVEQQLKEQRRIMEKLNAQEANLQEEIRTLKKTNTDELYAKDQLHQENLEFQKTMKTTLEEIKQLQQETEKSQKQFDNLKRRKALDDDERKELELQRNALKSDVASMLRELERLKKGVDADRRQIVDLLHERDLVNKNVIKGDERMKKQTELVKRHESATQVLAKDVAKVKQDLQDSLKRVYDLDKQREKYGIELSLANTKHMQSLEELKNRENKISELRKNLADVKGKLATQKQLYEAVRTDRNLYSKNLIESQDEIAEMKRKFKIMYHQIEQLKEEIKEKDQALIKEHFEHQKVTKKCELIKDQLERAKKRQRQLLHQVETQSSDIKKLESTIQEAEQERQSRKREYEGVISERDILGTQLIRRNDELALLYEKIKIQQSTLQKGEIQYKERLEELRTLRIKIASCKREMHIAKQQVVNIDDLKKEVYQLQRELLQERTKVKALSEELENPMNVHRWRKLEGTDPATYEMIQKVKTLQRRLIAKTEEAVEKDLLIQEKEKLYLELKSILSSQPGPEVAEQVAVYQQKLKEKTKQMKSMAAELNMYHAQVNDYKDDIERQSRELSEMKRKYFDQKRREQLLKDSYKRGTTSTGDNAKAAAEG